MPLYLITTHHDREGVTLSKPGHWGNLPFPNDEAATAAALEDAKARREPDPQIKSEKAKRRRA